MAPALAGGYNLRGLLRYGAAGYQKIVDNIDLSFDCIVCIR
jgi:hypothetical protein